MQELKIGANLVCVIHDAGVVSIAQRIQRIRSSSVAYPVCPAPGRHTEHNAASLEEYSVNIAADELVPLIRFLQMADEQINDK